MATLFEFKAGFSRLRRPFYTWRAVVDEVGYASLVGRWEARWGAKADAQDGFFPAYRKPVTPGSGVPTTVGLILQPHFADRRLKSQPPRHEVRLRGLSRRVAEGRLRALVARGFNRRVLGRDQVRL